MKETSESRHHCLLEEGGKHLSPLCFYVREVTMFLIFMGDTSGKLVLVSILQAFMCPPRQKKKKKS